MEKFEYDEVLEYVYNVEDKIRVHKIGSMICYNLKFIHTPEFDRNIFLNNIDIIHKLSDEFEFYAFSQFMVDIKNAGNEQTK